MIFCCVEIDQNDKTIINGFDWNIFKKSSKYRIFVPNAQVVKSFERKRTFLLYVEICKFLVQK